VRFLHLYRLMICLMSQLHFIRVLKDAKPQVRRALLASKDDELIKAIVECAINKLSGNHKLNIEEKSNLKNIRIVYEHSCILKSDSRVYVNL